MNRYFLAMLSILIFGCTTQRGYKELEKTRQHCMSIQEGSYQMEHRFKPLSGPDTIQNLYQTSFRNLPEDTLFRNAFHTRLDVPLRSFTSFTLYTGQELVNFPRSDSSAEYTSASQWAEHISEINHNYQFFEPLTTSKAYPFPSPEDLETPHTLTYEGKETIHGQQTRHWKIIFPETDIDTSEAVYATRVARDYWINPKTNLPVQVSEIYDLQVFGEASTQFNSWALLQHQDGPVSDPELFTMAAVPERYPLKDFQPYEPEPLLSAGTDAPGFSHPTLDGQQLSLADLRGKWVLVDFFYRSCYPCMKALPHLVEFKRKHQGENVIVIGIDPFDDPKPELKQFLANLGVDYPILLQSKETAQAYRVSGYPVLYFIGPDGKILENENGYGEGMEEEWDKWVEKYVK